MLPGTCCPFGVLPGCCVLVWILPWARPELLVADHTGGSGLTWATSPQKLVMLDPQVPQSLNDCPLHVCPWALCPAHLTVWPYLRRLHTWAPAPRLQMWDCELRLSPLHAELLNATASLKLPLPAFGLLSGSGFSQIHLSQTVTLQGSSTGQTQRTGSLRRTPVHRSHVLLLSPV